MILGHAAAPQLSDALPSASGRVTWADAIAAPVVVFAGHTRALVHANPAMVAFAGVRAPADLGGLDAMAWWKPDGFLAAVGRILERGGTAMLAERAMSPTGELLSVEVALTVTYPAADEPLVVATIGDRGRLDGDGERRARERLETVVEVVGDLSHEFGNLLTVVQSYGMLAAQGAAPGSSEREDLDALVEAADRATVLVREMGRFRRRAPGTAAAIDLAKFVRIRAPFLAKLAGARIAVEFFTPDGALVGHADQALLEAAMLALIHAGADAMPDGGRITVGFTALADGGTMRVRLARSHPESPAPPDAAATVAAALRRVGAALSGRTTVVGTTDEIDGEVVFPSTAGVPVPGRRGHAASPGAAPVRVVVADASEVARGPLAAALRAAGFDVVEVGGADAVRAALQADGAPPGALVAEAALPGLGGAHLVRAARERHAALPIVLIAPYDLPGVGGNGVQVIRRSADVAEVVGAVRAVSGANQA